MSTTSARATIAFRSAGTGVTYTYDIGNRHLTTVAGGTTVTYVRDLTDRIVACTETGSTTKMGYTGSDDIGAATLNAAGNVRTWSATAPELSLRV